MLVQAVDNTQDLWPCKICQCVKNGTGGSLSLFPFSSCLLAGSAAGTWDLVAHRFYIC